MVGCGERSKRYREGRKVPTNILQVIILSESAPFVSLHSNTICAVICSMRQIFHSGIPFPGAQRNQKIGDQRKMMKRDLTLWPSLFSIYYICSFPLSKTLQLRHGWSEQISLWPSSSPVILQFHVAIIISPRFCQWAPTSFRPKIYLAMKSVLTTSKMPKLMGSQRNFLYPYLYPAKINKQEFGN